MQFAQVGSKTRILLFFPIGALLFAIRHANNQPTMALADMSAITKVGYSPIISAGDYRGKDLVLICHDICPDHHLRTICCIEIKEFLYLAVSLLDLSFDFST